MRLRRVERRMFDELGQSYHSPSAMQVWKARSKHVGCRGRREDARNVNGRRTDQSLLTSAPTIFNHWLCIVWPVWWLMTLSLCGQTTNQTNAPARPISLAESIELAL